MSKTLTKSAAAELYRYHLFAWYGQAIAVHRLMPSKDRRSLAAFEATMSGGGDGGTGAWPGWDRYIGPQPRPEDFGIVNQYRQRSPRKPISLRTTLQVFKRDDFRCRHCGTDDVDELVVDHIIPLALGGADSIDNYQTLCATCNGRKGAR